MEKLHFHCQNCDASANILNVTHIEELKERINSNLITRIWYNTVCDNSIKTISELERINDYRINHIHPGLTIYNMKLIEKYGYILYIGAKDYYKFTGSVTWRKMSENEFFDLIKEGTLLRTCDYENFLIDMLNDTLNEKCHNFYLIPIAHCPKHYRVEKFTMTKPAKK